MTRLKFSNREILLLAAVIGLIATLAAPWLELRGTWQSWRIVEWHTFWRGDGAFMLADLVAASFTLPIEFATSAMRDTVHLAAVVGTVLALWHTLVFLALVGIGANARLRRGLAGWRVAAETVLILLAVGIVLYSLALIFALPSSLAPKVDFRTPTDLHSDSLVWSSVTIFPIAPALSLLAAVVQSVMLTYPLRGSRGRRSAIDGRSL